MNEPLTAEQRRKIAEACGRSIACFEPDEIATHFRDLVRTVAQMIEKRSNHEPTIGYLLRFNKLLAENNVPAIERMAYELLEGRG